MSEEHRTVRDNLIAARALIDTPDKFEALGLSQSAALYQVTSTWQEYVEADQALSAIRLRGVGHANLLATFDRAIAAVSP